MKIKIPEGLLKSEYLNTLLQNYFNNLLDYLERDMEGFLMQDYFFMEDKNVYYDKNTVALFPIFKDFPKKDVNMCKVSDVLPELTYFSIGNGFTWDFPTIDEVKKAFSFRANYPCKFGDYYIKFASANASYLSYKENNNVFFYYTFSNSYHEQAGTLIGIHRLDVEDATPLSKRQMLIVWLKNGLTPQGMSESSSEKYRILLTELAAYDCKYDKNGTILSFDMSKVIDSIRSGKFPISSNYIVKQLQKIDGDRVGYISYDADRFYDPNLGHWDIYPNKYTGDYLDIDVDVPIYPRDPAIDVRDGGVIGIDLTHDSCVVVCQDYNEVTLPIAITSGTNDPNRVFASPTMLKIRDIESFVHAYMATGVRPHTLAHDVSIASYEDITAPHRGYTLVPIFGDSDNGDSDTNTQANDNENLKNSMSNIDYVEIYAYCIGSLLNNFARGIFLEYVLTFSALTSFDKREKYLASFKRGIIKSLPLGIIANDELANNIHIYYGTTDATAYALSAIKAHKILDNTSNHMLFSTFDVKETQVDYSFGFIRNAKTSQFDYIVEDFEIYGDEGLGSEKVLAASALYVIKNNINTIKEHKIDFEILNTSAKGILDTYREHERMYKNLRTIMGKLKALIETSSGSGNTITVDLVTDDNMLLRNVPLAMDPQQINKIYLTTIEHAIDLFFKRMYKIFAKINLYTNTNDIAIFLNCNNINTPIFMHLLNKYIHDHKLSPEVHFTIYPPVENADYSKPNYVTASAFGVIDARAGSRVKIIHRYIDTVEVVDNNFKYYVGYNEKGKFKCIIDPSTSYEDWIELYPASEDAFELYYTDKAEAASGDMSINLSTRKRIRINKKELYTNIYIKPRSINVLEYVITTPEKINDDYLIYELAETIGEIKL